MRKPPLNIVWFKRDLRTQDHAPLFEAAKCGHVLPLYIIEPEYWQEPDTSKRQWEFIEECLSELDEDLQSLGAQLVTKVGNVVGIFRAAPNLFLGKNFNNSALNVHWRAVMDGTGVGKPSCGRT